MSKRDIEKREEKDKAARKANFWRLPQQNKIEKELKGLGKDGTITQLKLNIKWLAANAGGLETLTKDLKKLAQLDDEEEQTELIMQMMRQGKVVLNEGEKFMLALQNKGRFGLTSREHTGRTAGDAGEGATRVYALQPGPRRNGGVRQ